MGTVIICALKKMKLSLCVITEKELSEAAYVEKMTMGSYTYLTDAFAHYQSVPGELIGVRDEDADGTLAGIGRFTVLPDGTGWLECLRVVPEYQNRGVGKLIYKRYLELKAKHSCSSIAMYTGLTNAASSGLAELYGLRTTSLFHGYRTSSEKCTDDFGFRPATPDEAAELMRCRDEYAGYLSLSRTFYRFTPSVLRYFASMGMVYTDAESGSMVIAGSRFQHRKALHVALVSGEKERCMKFAKGLAGAMGIPDIIMTVASPSEIEGKLTSLGLVRDNGEIIVKELKN